MAKPRWWVCGSCKSLNDMPAAKCYKCRAAKPADPTLLDDQYGQVSRGPRVGVTVDVSRIPELAARDPLETQRGSGIPEPLDQHDGPAAGAWQVSHPASPVPPMREPVKRGITAIGGLDWRTSLASTGEPPAQGGGEGSTTAAPPGTPAERAAGSVPPAAGSVPPAAGSVPPAAGSVPPGAPRPPGLPPPGAVPPGPPGPPSPPRLPGTLASPAPPGPPVAPRPQGPMPPPGVPPVAQPPRWAPAPPGPPAPPPAPLVPPPPASPAGPGPAPAPPGTRRPEGEAGSR